MIVYLAEIAIPYEVGYTVGVFSTGEKAAEAIEDWRRKNDYGEGVVSEWEVDKPYA